MSRTLPGRLLAFVALPAAVAGLLAGCATVGLEAVIRRPEAAVVGVQIERLTFRDARVRFDVEVHNPNAVTVRVGGYEYELLIEGAPFVKGNADTPVELPPGERSVIQVPVEVGFANLIDTYSSLRTREEFAYALSVGLYAQLPVLGRVRVGANREGTLPVVQLPRFRLQWIAIRDLRLRGAGLVLGLEMNNPNSFGFAVKGLDYRFFVSGRQWASGVMSRPLEVSREEMVLVELPVDVSFQEIGRSARDLLTGDRPMDYAFDAEVALQTGLDLIGDTVLPIRLSGRIALRR